MPINRCVKFSPAPLDLLAVNQHSRTTHVIDARNYTGMQSLTVPIYGRRNDLTGAFHCIWMSNVSRPLR